MKLVAVAVLVVGLFCNSTLAMAEGPVPFSALMQPAGAEPSIPPLDDSKDQSAAGSTRPAHKPRMTSSGKIMTGVGIGMAAIGAVLLIGTATVKTWATPTDNAELYGAGGATMGVGATLIVLGDHRRETK